MQDRAAVLRRKPAALIRASSGKVVPDVEYEPITIRRLEPAISSARDPGTWPGEPISPAVPGRQEWRQSHWHRLSQRHLEALAGEQDLAAERPAATAREASRSLSGQKWESKRRWARAAAAASPASPQIGALPPAQPSLKATFHWIQSFLVPICPNYGHRTVNIQVLVMTLGGLLARVRGCRGWVASRACR